jgi:hypothetical protein
VLLTPQDVAAVGEARRALARAGTPLAESFVRVGADGAAARLSLECVAEFAAPREWR